MTLQIPDDLIFEGRPWAVLQDLLAPHLESLPDPPVFSTHSSGVRRGYRVDWQIDEAGVLRVVGIEGRCRAFIRVDRLEGWIGLVSGARRWGRWWKASEHAGAVQSPLPSGLETWHNAGRRRFLYDSVRGLLLGVPVEDADEIVAGRLSTVEIEHEGDSLLIDLEGAVWLGSMGEIPLFDLHNLWLPADEPLLEPSWRRVRAAVSDDPRAGSLDLQVMGYRRSDAASANVDLGRIDPFRSELRDATLEDVRLREGSRAGWVNGEIHLGTGLSMGEKRAGFEWNTGTSLRVAVENGRVVDVLRDLD